MDKLVRHFLSANGDSRKVITDADARYFGIEVNDQNLTPGEHPRLGPTRFADGLSRSILPKQTKAGGIGNWPVIVYRLRNPRLNSHTRIAARIKMFVRESVPTRGDRASAGGGGTAPPAERRRPRFFARHDGSFTFRPFVVCFCRRMRWRLRAGWFRDRYFGSAIPWPSTNFLRERRNEVL